MVLHGAMSAKRSSQSLRKGESFQLFGKLVTCLAKKLTQVRDMEGQKGFARCNVSRNKSVDRVTEA